MKIAGVVAEFNPFHKGHEYLINQIKKDNPDLIVCAMSPNFVMRGEPAIFNKWFRTSCALNYGIDIIAEIPTIYTIQSADVYAKRGIEILNNLGVTDLYFGVENDNEFLLRSIAEEMNSKRYFTYLKSFLDLGNSFNTSSKKALIKINQSFEKILSSPNNLLAIEYIKSVSLINPSINIHLVKRVDALYFDEFKKGSKIQSASAIREALESGKLGRFLEYSTKNQAKHVKNDYLNLIKYRIFSSSSEELKNIQGINEGIENQIKSLKEISSYTTLVDDLVSRRNRETKINRILMAILLNIKKTEISTKPLTYVRILGFNKNGQEYLKNSKNSPVPIYTCIKRGQNTAFYRELDFDRIYLIDGDSEILKMEYQPIILDV